jgi:hypothetical protein
LLQIGSKNVIFRHRFMSRSVLNLIGVAVLVVGLGLVAQIERNAQYEEAHAMEDSEATHALLHPEDYGSYVRSAETMGGKFGLLLDGWLTNALGLGHSRSFAVTVAVISLIAATGIFARSNLPSRNDHTPD